MLVHLLILSLFVNLILAVDPSTLLINAPQPNQQIISKSKFNIIYTIVGGQTTNPPFAAYYFNSLSAEFVWKERTSGRSLSLGIQSSLDVTYYPGGLQNKIHTYIWSVPNCHFFSRYPPHQYDYSLLFTPSYPTVTDSTPVTGSEQLPVTVPITIQVNNGTFPKC